ncbi:D-2-hydroxyacid dehydrogenase [Neisseria montereyensis]|uniref:D-2-hydroxyacid dehydrogenase n=1 Tax=Neisseria montereyensis TaxID=2973938 RepID=A0ABT2FER0_9NEIS|nr:D-2-hydroxyacid dehydrogenase [Neisseria montereyensis]MCS4534677.1 D-2-hydroxyacid dehydrogenase [Neisseria montereyensis]
MNTLKVVVLDRGTLPGGAFAFDFPFEIKEYENTLPEQTAERIQEADIVVTNKVVMDKNSIAAAPNLKLIAVGATGVNHIDMQAANQAGVTVCNVRNYGNDSVAEHAFMLMIALMRNLPAYQRDIAAGVWEKSPYFCHFGAPIRNLNGKTLAIFGRGSTGRTLAGFARAFGMKVIFGEHKHAQTVREDYVSFDEAIQSADVVSLHCPLTAETTNMIGETELQQMKMDAILINCARGGLVDENALVAALKYGGLGGAGVDVLTQEPPRDGNPLLKARLPNLIITPHMAWGSNEATSRLFDILLDNINQFVAGTPKNVV